MPNYKNAQYFSTNTSEVFDQTYHPGMLAPVSGIYRCEACGYEADSTKGKPLPPSQTCPQHAPDWKCNHGRVLWRLVAAAVHRN
jgi:hypothetical protein